MAFDPESPGTPDLPPATPTANGNGAGSEPDSDSRARSEKELPDELAQLYRMLAVVLAERDEYRRLLGPDWKKAVEQDLLRFAREECTEDAQPLERFLPEIEAILNGAENT